MDIRILLAAGKQPFTLADALRPALTEYLAGAAHLMRGTHQMLEGVFEVAGKIAPVSDIQLKALQDLRYFLRNRSFLVIAQDSTRPINQFDIISETEG